MKKLDVLAFITPILICVEVNLIGRLYLTELILLLFLFSNRVGKVVNDTKARKIIFFLSVWLVAQIFTDLYRGTDLSDFLRGWSKIVFITINFVAILSLIQGNQKRLMIFISGLGIGIIVSEGNSGLYTDFSTIWKMGVGIGVTICVLAAVSFIKPNASRTTMLVLMLTIALFSFLVNARSLGGIIFISALYFFFYSSDKPKYFKELSIVRILTLFGISLISVSLLSTFYGELVSNGVFGEEAKYKYYSQNLQQFGPFGILLGGRSEILVSSAAIKDSPIIGHGSWAKNIKYRMMLTEIKSDLKDETLKDANVSDENYALIPSHSHLFGAWVESGFLGAIFWLYVFFQIAKVLININAAEKAYRPLLIFLCLLSMWDILFSPLGGSRRIFWGSMLVVIVILLSNKSYEKSVNFIRNRCEN